MKFGGTSIGSADAIRNTVDIIAQSKSRSPFVIVSAIGGVTDLLISAANRAADGDIGIQQIRERHYTILKDLKLVPSLVDSELEELENSLKAISYLRKVMPQMYAVVVSYGELISSKIIAEYASTQNLNTKAYSALDLGIITDSNHEDAEVAPETFELLPKHLKEIPNNVIPIMTGFIAKDREGFITTLGRGGSDYTASLVGAAVNAEEVQIWTDVDGIMTADPRMVKDARVISEMGSPEASELAYFGSKIMHPKTIVPAMQKNIPVKILNTFNSKAAGTTIRKDVNHKRAVTALAYKKGITAISVISPTMLFTSGFMANVFDIFAKHSVSVDMISTSEVSISVTIDSRYDIVSLVKDLKPLGKVEVIPNRASISVVGSGIVYAPGVSGIIFSALGDQNINVEMISSGVSGINVSMTIKEEDCKPALNALHDAFFSRETLKSGPVVEKQSKNGKNNN